MLDINPILQGKGYPLYTKRFKDICNFYLKDGELLKNRGDKFTTKLGEVMNFNDIVIEENGHIEIFCSKEKEKLYQKEIEFLKEHYCKSIEKFVKIISRNY